MRDHVFAVLCPVGTPPIAKTMPLVLNSGTEALRRAGPDPTPRRVARTLELMSPWRYPDYGGIPVVFTPHDHVGFHTGFLAQVRNGRWTTLTGALPPALRPH